MARPYSCSYCPLGKANQQLADLGQVLWLRWVGHTHCDVTMTVAARYVLCLLAKTLHIKLQAMHLAAVAVHVAPGTFPWWWQHSRVLAADVVTAAPSPGCTPSALGSLTPVSSCSRPQVRTSRIPVLRSCRVGLELNQIVHPKIPKERGGLGVQGITDLVLVPC